MSSNLKVNTILPSVGTAIGIGTAGDTITSIGSITVTNGRIGIGTAAPLQRLHIRGEGQGDHLLYLQAGDTICDIIQSDNGGSTRLRSANGSFYIWTGGDGNSSTGENGSPAFRVDTNLEAKFYNSILVPDKIEHDQDSDTAIRFPAYDTVSVETGGSERVRISGAGVTVTGQVNATSFVGSGSGLTSLNSPSFHAGMFSSGDVNITDSTYAIIPNSDEEFDIGGCYNNTGSTVTLNGISTPAYAFAPNVAGYYHLYGSVHLHNSTSAKIQDARIKLTKNGSMLSEHYFDPVNAPEGQFNRITLNMAYVVYLNGTSDYVQAHAYTNIESGTPSIEGNRDGTYFFAYKLSM